MQASPVIRATEPDDAAQIAAIFRTPSAARGTLQHPYLTTASSRARIEGRPPGDLYLVAVVEGEVVGTLSLARPTNPRRSHTALLGMAVREDWQGKGIGSALLRAALDQADNWMGLVRIELSAWHDNHGAIALYQRFGFELEGRYRWNGLRDGKLTDSVAMARLRPPATGEAAPPTDGQSR